MYKNKVKSSFCLILLLAVIVNCLPLSADHRARAITTTTGLSDKVNQPLASVTPPAGLVGWWPGDGHARDISGNGNNGTLTGSTGFAVSKVGQGFDFPTTNNLVQVPFNPVFNVATAITVEAWVSTTANFTGASSLIAGRPNNYQLFKRDDGHVGLAILIGGTFSNNIVDSTTTLPTNTLTHVVGTYDAATGQVKIYVNGVLEGTTNTSGNPDSNNEPFGIGGFFGFFDCACWKGQIDEVSLYGRALSQSEIQSIFNAGVNGKTKSVPTNAGTNVSNLVSDATITFSNVTAAGTTTDITIDPATAGTLPPTFSHTGLAYDISTTAAVSGNINIGFHLPCFTDATQFSHLKVLHNEAGVLVDRTASQNFSTFTLFAQPVSSLSPFVIANGDQPTAVTLEAFTATEYGDGRVLVEWQTGLEVDNLGFNIYREEGLSRVRINPQCVAGSALLVGPAVRLGAGRSYAWNDIALSSQDARYWLEEVDLKGHSTWHGPVMSQKAEDKRQKAGLNRPTFALSEIGKSEPQHTSSPLERRALPAKFTAESIEAQVALASQRAAKIAVRREGWYRIARAELDAAGLNTKVDPRLLQLFVDGTQVPIIVSGEQDGRFDSADAIEFYGVGLDSPYTDSRVYWLVAADQAGMRIKQTNTDGRPTSARNFSYTVERRDRTVYFSGLRNGEKENFFGAVIAREPVDQQLTLSHLARADSSAAQLEIVLQGVTLADHHVSVELNGVPVGEVVFNGQSQGASRFNVSQSLLREGANMVRLTPLASNSDVSLVDYVRVSYQHSYSADNDALKLTGAGQEQITVDGFTSKSIRVFDVTDANSPEELKGDLTQQKTDYSMTFTPAREGQRVLLILAGPAQSATVTLDRPSNLRNANASFVMVTTREFGASLEPLVALREKQGLSTAVIDIEDIYDEFSFGQKTPFAVRDFLAYAKSGWKKKPRFVLFAGDASVDPKNYLAFGDSDLVPTKLIDTDFMETSSDDWLCDFNNDGIADIATGRLPARTADELSAMVSKIISYEHSSPGEETLLVADANDGFDFEQASTELRSLIPPGLRITQVNRGRLDPEMARRSLFEALERKQILVNYAGHGSVNQWRGNLLTNDDGLALRNDHLTMFVMMTCLNGYFQDAVLDSLGESLIKAEGGGAVAVWASSGMTMPADQALLNRELYRLLFNSGGATTIGEAVMRAKASLSNADIRRTWVLLGDPALRLR